ncbi:hypothetical protein EW145_g6262 [Phellinidium pouzarii]|uniref:EamA domain-containing protein n=1 Tax=Phellinidium pouzarii TaxID=167371 RepID=A0A4S4KX65_9AGAM|nr:hypothetical protein EW145_g6262 [Phellinidium pouzarii]
MVSFRGYEPLSMELPEAGEIGKTPQSVSRSVSESSSGPISTFNFHVGNVSRSRISRPAKMFIPVTNFVNERVQKSTSIVKANAGLLLVAASQAFFALMNVAVKKLNSLDPPVPTLELVAVRMGITYICCMTYMLWRGVPDPFLGPKDVRFLLVFRGFSGFFGLFGIYYSLQYLSLSDATVLTFLSPLTTAIAGCFFLGEVFKRRDALAGVLSLIGVIFIARPEAIFGPHPIPHSSLQDGVLDPAEKGTSAQRLGAVGIALVGVLGATGAYTSLRAIGKLVAIVGMLVFREKFILPTRIEWLALLVMIGIFGFLAQVLLTLGLQRETAGRGAMAIYVQIIFASILERIFFHTVPSLLSVTGTVIIIGSAVFVAITKQSGQASKPVGDPRSNSDIALDLELGVTEPERQRFLAHENVSRMFVEDEVKAAVDKEVEWGQELEMDDNRSHFSMWEMSNLDSDDDHGGLRHARDLET